MIEFIILSNDKLIFVLYPRNINYVECILKFIIKIKQYLKLNI